MWESVDVVVSLPATITRPQSPMSHLGVVSGFLEEGGLWLPGVFVDGVGAFFLSIDQVGE